MLYTFSGRMMDEELAWVQSKIAAITMVKLSVQ